jgi:succinyl-diaminopimelate desuccinylase
MVSYDMSAAALHLTRELLVKRTVNPPGEEDACTRHVGSLLESAGFHVAYHAFDIVRTSLIATLAGVGDHPALCFTGHVDTVPLGAAEWSVDPFGAEIDGDRLYGRGASDMKSGVAAMVVAAIEIAKLPRQQAGLVLIITAGEETGCDGARHLARVVKAVPKAGALIVGEPTGNVPLIGHKGALWLRACFCGRTAHGSMPEQGDNAVYKAARSLLRLEHYGFDVPAHRHLGRPTINVGSIKGGLNVNSVPDWAEVGIDIRTIPAQNNEAIIAEIGGVLGQDATLQPFVDVGAVASDPQNDWISDVFDLYERRTGARADPSGAPFFTDASELTPAMGGVPTIILGPGETIMAHKTDEYCLIPKIGEAVELYREIALRWPERQTS